MAIILHIENPKDATRKLIEFNSEFGSVAEYKINTRNLFHLYTLVMKDKEKLRKPSYLPPH